MTHLTVARVGWLRAAVLSTIVATAAGPTGAVCAGAQSRAAPPMRSWIDQYYADYTAMSGAPTGPAMDKWLAHYAPYAFFEDPTAGLSGIGHDRIRKPYVEAFTGPLGPVHWTILRRVTSGEWTAVEGWVDGTQTGQPVRARFTTWLKIRDGKIVHQIDYLDYATIRRQVAGEEVVPREGGEPPATATRGRHDAHRALRLTEEFYRRYESLPVVASPAAGLARFVELLTEDFRLEDPTGRLSYSPRAAMHAALRRALATGDQGPIHWEIDRRIAGGEWVAVEGSLRGVYKGHPFATRFATWLQVPGDRIARQIDYVDYATFRRMTSPPKAP
ncbi:MAG: SnoaL-like polyketide cyclase [Geminicoccaceae bacterium]|nr:SnoaL-like polyketide cyclase [Geminicoccaceae bacterium]